jgi:hypothetical protein
MTASLPLDGQRATGRREVVDEAPAVHRMVEAALSLIGLTR